VSGERDDPVVGLDIQNSGGGRGVEITSGGSNGLPSVGAESTLVVPSGRSGIGTRIVQNGLGIGMKIVQTGPGVGFKSTVIAGKKTEDN
jgi:hypothetical protein